jgi:hypothetical protein
MCACLQARLLFTLQLRLRSQRGKLGDFYAWNACLSHILALAQVHSCIFTSCCRWACCVCMSNLVAHSTKLRKHIAGYALSLPQLSCTCC